MATPGETITIRVRRQTDAGAASTGKSAVDFVVYVNGSSTSISDFSDDGTMQTYEAYSFSVPLPSTNCNRARIDVFGKTTTDTDVIEPSYWTGEIETYDTTDIAGLISTSSGVGSGDSVADDDWGEVVDGDSFAKTVTISLSKLSVLGYSDLTGFTVSASARQAPDDPASPVSLHASVVSITARTIRVAWGSSTANTMPTAMRLTTGTDDQEWYCDVRLTHDTDGTIITGSRGSLRVRWERHEST